MYDGNNLNRRSEVEITAAEIKIKTFQQKNINRHWRYCYFFLFIKIFSRFCFLFNLKRQTVIMIMIRIHILVRCFLFSIEILYKQYVIP